MRAEIIRKSMQKVVPKRGVQINRATQQMQNSSDQGMHELERENKKLKKILAQKNEKFNRRVRKKDREMVKKDMEITKKDKELDTKRRLWKNRAAENWNGIAHSSWFSQLSKLSLACGSARSVGFAYSIHHKKNSVRHESTTIP